MRRRSRASSKLANARSRKAQMPKRRNARTVRHRSSAPDQETEIARLTHELAEARKQLTEAQEQQTASGDVLKVISHSTFDLQAVLDTLVKSAARLCEADMVGINRPRDGAMRFAANFGLPREFEEIAKRNPFVPGRGTVVGRVLLAGKPVQIADVEADPEYTFTEGQRVAGYRTILGVPLEREGESIGVIVLIRTKVQPFTDKQIELAQSFAAQAVIAIENARLLNELRQSLEQQSATSEVLRVISSSPGELKPVFQAMLENAVRVCGAKFGTLYLSEGNGFRTVAMHDVPPAFAELREREPVIVPLPGGGLDQLTKTKQVVHITDYSALPPQSRGRLGDLGGARTVVIVPMFKDNELAGAIVIYRQEVRPFTDKQIALVQNFAAQAVIAIENTRLLNELRQRTDDLTESLEQQTATSEVLKVISSSPGDLQPVFEAMLANATRLCEAKFGALWLCEGDALRTVALNAPPAFAEERQRQPLILPTPETGLGRAVKTKLTVHSADLLAEEHVAPVLAKLAGARTYLAVPMLKDNEVIGAIGIYRQEVRPFTDKQVALVENFAAQAVIAIENTRLLNELRQSLEQQTATADVLRVISSSPGELEPVFQAMLANATRICEAKFGTLFRFEGDAYRAVATHNAPQELTDEYGRHGLRQPTPGGILDRMLRTKQVCHTADYAAESVHGTAARFGGARSIVCVPMVKDNVLIGAFSIYRQEVRPFTDKQIALLENFAAQAVIAIENTRLLSELRESLKQQTATADVLKVISRSTFDLKAVLRTLVESAAHLCEADISNIALPTADDTFQIEADYAQSAALSEELRRQKFKPGPGGVISRTVLSRSKVHILDAQTDPDYQLREALRIGGYHTMLGVPMLREGNIVGVFGLARNTVRPFTEKQIELVATFAAQAVIAIENARLLNELRQRTTDLSESLEQQTATSKVLEVISRSAFDLQAVFETVAESSVRLCGADRAFIYRFDGEFLRVGGWFNTPEKLKDFRSQNPIRPGRSTASGRAAAEHRTIHIPDVLADPEYSDGSKNIEAIRTILSVPILKGDDLLGVVGIYTLEEVRPFTDKQIALVETFADQAAIAIDNVRLLDELRQSLEQQTATADMLKLISRSTFDLRSVLNTLVESAARLCEADITTISRETCRSRLRLPSRSPGLL
jgi:two-component system, NtrC family, sensor kinase